MRLKSILAAAAALALTVGGATAGATHVGSPDGGFDLALDGWVRPARIAPDEPVPVAFHLTSELTSPVGSLPDTRTFSFEADRSVSLDVSGLPVCRMLGMPVSPPPWRACKAGIVGQGEMTVLYRVPEGVPVTIKGKLVVYNGGAKGGQTKLWVRTYLSVPRPNVSLAKMKVKRVRKGRYGTKVGVSIPTLAAKFGTLVSFDLTLGKKIVSASCPDGHLSVRGSTSLEGAEGKVELPFAATRRCA